MLVPAEALAGAEGVLDLRDGLKRAQRQHERAGRVDAAVRVGQRERLFLGHGERVVRGVVLDVAAGRLAAQPLRDVPLIGVGLGGEFGGGGRRLGQRPVQAQPVAEYDVPGRDRRPQVPDELVHKRH
jgi:hypothetical protein